MNASNFIWSSHAFGELDGRDSKAPCDVINELPLEDGAVKVLEHVHRALATSEYVVQAGMAYT